MEFNLITSLYVCLLHYLPCVYAKFCNKHPDGAQYGVCTHFHLAVRINTGEQI